MVLQCRCVEVADFRREHHKLKQQFVELREVHLALCELLEEEGVLSSQRLYARVHRRRFAAVRHEHPCDHIVSISDALGINGPASAVARFAGSLGTVALHITSSSLSRATREAGHSAVGPRHGKLYVCGGLDTREYLRTAECLDPASGSWESLPPMCQRRRGAAAAAISGRLYVCGGSSNGTDTLNSAERFDPLFGVWEELPPMARRRRGAAAAVLGGCLCVCGGSADGWDTSSVERYDPRTGAWDALPSMCQQRLGAAAATLNGNLYVCGGSCDGWQTLSSAERFDPVAGTWELLPTMAHRRCVAVGAAIGDHPLGD